MTNEEMDEIIRRANVALFGFDISKLSYEEQNEFKAQDAKRRELQAALDARKPKPILSEAEALEKRRLSILEAKFDKIGGGKKSKDLTNAQLEKQLKVLQKVVKGVR